MKKNTSQLLENKILNKEKKDFIFWGILNLIFTNALLQILLFFSEIIISTLISQFFNIMFGYIFYSKKVFKVNKYSFSKFFIYLLLSFLSWNLNWFFILKLYELGFSKNFGAIIIAPFLASNSYLIQKYFIFRKLKKIKSNF